MGSGCSSPGDKGQCGSRWGKMNEHPWCTSTKSNTCGLDMQMLGAGRRRRMRRQTSGRRRRRCLLHGKWSLSRQCCGCRCSGIRKVRRVSTAQAERWSCGGPQGRFWRWRCLLGKRCAGAEEWPERGTQIQKCTGSGRLWPWWTTARRWGGPRDTLYKWCPRKRVPQKLWTRGSPTWYRTGTHGGSWNPGGTDVRRLCILPR